MDDKKLVTLEEYGELASKAGIDLKMEVASGFFYHTVTRGGETTHPFITREDLTGKLLGFLYEKLAGQEVRDV